jgi:hypothetical protein
VTGRSAAVSLRRKRPRRPERLPRPPQGSRPAGGAVAALSSKAAVPDDSPYTTSGIGLLDELAADDTVLTCDSGTIATWAARHWTIRGD